jgi:hypothetical protein
MVPSLLGLLCIKLISGRLVPKWMLTLFACRTMMHPNEL